MKDRPTSPSRTPDAEAHAPIRSSYSRLAGIYDVRWRRYIEATTRAAREAADLKGGERVLDVACGTGVLLEAMTAEHPELRAVGLDLTLPMLVEARRRLGRRPFLQAGTARLPFADGAFDLVFCVNSFHYFRRPMAALWEAHRVLRPGGRFVLLDWCHDYLRCKLCGMWLRWRDPAFFRMYGLRECRAMLERAGFRIDAADRFRASWVWGMMRFVGRRP